MTGWRFFFLLCCSVLFVVFDSAAYTVTQPKATWPCGDILMEPHLGPVGGVLADGRTSWDQVVGDAMAVWNANLVGVRFSTRMVGGSCADLDNRNSICWSTPVEEPA